MTIDTHVHLFFPGSDPEECMLGYARVGAASAGRAKGVMMDPTQILAASWELINDQTAEKLLQKMKRAGIDRSILLPLDLWACVPGSEDREGSMKIEDKNKLYQDLAGQYPDKFSTMVGIDPRRKDATALFHKMMGKEPAPVGLKLHPTVGFYPDAQVCYPLYRAALQYDLPVLIHSGSQPGPLHAKYAEPKYIDTVAGDFPDMRIIIAHCGHGWWQEAIDLASAKANLYVDFSGWQRQYDDNPDYFWEPLRRAMDVLGPWRVFFGTDGSLLDVIMDPRKWVKAIQARSSTRGFTFTDDEIEIFLHKAAEKFYHF